MAVALGAKVALAIISKEGLEAKGAKGAKEVTLAKVTSPLVTNKEALDLHAINNAKACVGHPRMVENLYRERNICWQIS